MQELSVSIRFRLLTEPDVKAVLTMDDLIATMASALQRFSTGRVVQPVRPTIPIADDAFFATMPAFVRGADKSKGAANFGGASPASAAALGAKLVTVFGSNAARGLHTHLATIVLLDPETGALLALLDGRYITEARTAAVSAVSSRLLARESSSSLAIIGTGVQARSHLEALSRVHQLRQVTVWSPNKLHRDQFVAEAKTAMGTDPGRTRDRPGTDPTPTSSVSRAGRDQVESRSRSGREQVATGSDSSYAVTAVDHAGEAVVGADIIVLVTSSPSPVLENGWVKPGAHVISVGACRPNQREMDPALVARARLYVDSRAAALVESGDVVMGMQEGRFTAGHIVAELGELIERGAGRTSDTEITVFKSLGLAVEDVTAADLAYRRAVERGIGQELTL
jgi:ornithine cyclodeaminase/alanine dehydrogenase-like protein (mu-crystallin family)